jgi:hypothetical protein
MLQAAVNGDDTREIEEELRVLPAYGKDRKVSIIIIPPVYSLVKGGKF